MGGDLLKNPVVSFKDLLKLLRVYSPTLGTVSFPNRCHNNTLDFHMETEYDLRAAP